MAPSPDAAASLIGPGQALFDQGPVQLVVQAWREGAPSDRAALAGARRAGELLAELAGQLPRARLVYRPGEPTPAGEPPVLGLMRRAVARLEEPGFTPMAAVAGAFADLVLATALAAGADGGLVNNGGDIALRPSPGQVLRVGLGARLADGRPSHALAVAAEDGVGGVATSGFGGRSLTKGVADAATCLAQSAALADAAATAVANATYVDHPAVVRCPAEELDPLTDLAGQLVTRRVGELEPGAVAAALAAGLARARALLARGTIAGALISLRGRVVMIPPGLAAPLAVAQPANPPGAA